MTSKGETVIFEVRWNPCDDKLRRSHNNADDAKRDGAYVMAFAAVEELEGMVSIGRAETKTGADYYVAPGDGYAQGKQRQAQQAQSYQPIRVPDPGMGLTQQAPATSTTQCFSNGAGNLTCRTESR